MRSLQAHDHSRRKCRPFRRAHPQPTAAIGPPHPDRASTAGNSRPPSGKKAVPAGNRAISAGNTRIPAGMVPSRPRPRTGPARHPASPPGISAYPPGKRPFPPGTSPAAPGQGPSPPGPRHPLRGHAQPLREDRRSRRECPHPSSEIEIRARKPLFPAKTRQNLPKVLAPWWPASRAAARAPGPPSLVPKLRLGMPMGAKLCFAGWGCLRVGLGSQPRRARPPCEVKLRSVMAFPSEACERA